MNGKYVKGLVFKETVVSRWKFGVKRVDKKQISTEIVSGKYFDPDVSDQIWSIAQIIYYFWCKKVTWGKRFLESRKFRHNNFNIVLNYYLP